MVSKRVLRMCYQWEKDNMKVRDILSVLKNAPKDLDLCVIDTEGVEYVVKGFYAPVVNGEGVEVADIEIERRT